MIGVWRTRGCGGDDVDGRRHKDSTDSGFVVKVNGEVLDTTTGRQRFGLTVAHELGHYLGLSHHRTDDTNFMWPFVLGTNTNVEYAQFWDMADHGFVRDFTP